MIVINYSFSHEYPDSASWQIDASQPVTDAQRAVRRLQADVAHLRGELSTNTWGQQLHHMTPLMLPTDGLLEVLIHFI